jgi:hypothetical protein
MSWGASRPVLIQRRHETPGPGVDALLNLALLMAVNHGAAQQAIGKVADEAVISTKKTAHVVAESAVPLFPTVAEKAADPVQPGRIPGFGE